MRREVSITEAAHVHSVSTKTIERWRKEGSIEARRVGRRWLYMVDVSDMADMSDTPKETLPVPVDPEFAAFLKAQQDLATDQKKIASELGKVLESVKGVKETLARIEGDAKREAEERARREEAKRRPWYKKLFSGE